jgi:hypothetical protein
LNSGASNATAPNGTPLTTTPLNMAPQTGTAPNGTPLTSGTAPQ